MSAQPPAFENVDKCRKCSTAFSLFTRKHHCRNCGRTFCNPCSQGNIPLPHFGITEAVRVCAECEREVRNGRAGAKPAAAVAQPAAVSRRQESKEEPVVAAPVAAKKVKNCTCNSPLCVCPPDAEEKPAEASRSNVSSAPVKKAAPQPAVAPQPSTSVKAQRKQLANFLGFGGSSRPTTVWNLKGDLNEQIREAVKAQDLSGINQLLGAGADAKYIDRTGNSLAHLAAMFNRYDIIEVLVKHGADLWIKNPSKETPVDLAPPALQGKMKALQPQPQ